MLRAFSLTAASLIAAACAPSSGKAEISTGARPFEITAVATFNEPWAMAFVPGTPYALITEKGGTLKLWQADGPVRDVADVPAVDYGGQGGFGGVQPSRGQGFDQQGSRSQGQMSNQGDWNQRGSGWGDRDQGRWQQGYGTQGYGQSQGDWGSSQQGWSNQGYGNRGNYGGGQGGPGGSGTITYAEFWLIPGPHAGRGPRGYQRSGQRIEEDVCERLSQHGQLDASDIHVKVQDGEVTLTGTVGSRQEKRMAEDALDSISGIKDVHNQLRVQQEQTPKQGGQSSRTQGSQAQGRVGKENANSNREKELTTASSS